MNNSAAISGLLHPAATRRSTSSSRPVSPNGAVAAAPARRRCYNSPGPSALSAASLEPC
jgi:hypothetical protein